MMRRVKTAVLAGDGIGPEVIEQALRLLQPLRDFGDCEFELVEGLVGGAALEVFGSPLPEETLEACMGCDAVLLGAVGGPQFDSWPAPQRPEAGLLRLRQALGGFANLRPARCHPALLDASPLRPEVVEHADVLVVRELLGGLYFGQPRGMEQNGQRSAFNTLRYSEHEIERVAHVAFRLARDRRRKVTSVDKANVLETSRLWREVVTAVGRRYPDITLGHMYVDACAMALVTEPSQFDVLLTENLFGDILSDQLASLVGSLGMLPSATLGGTVDLYEPVHGSAPGIAGQDRANPLGAILSLAMLLRHTPGLHQEAADIEAAVDSVLETGYRTADLAQPGRGSVLPVSTSQMGTLVEQALTDILDRRFTYHAV